MRPTGFEIPIRILPLGNAVTPGEYAQLKVAIGTWEREHAQTSGEGDGIGDLTRIEATRVKLGGLGEGMIVSFDRAPTCGATGNCPMALLVRAASGYRLAVMSGGWGYALLSSGGSVPDIAFYWHMSAFESDAQVFHYAHDQFGATGPIACTDKSSSNPICAAAANTATAQGALSPAEYDALRPAVEASLPKQSAAPAHEFSFDDAHGMKVFGMQLVSATAVGMGPCGVNSNCDISIYAHHGQGGTYWPLLRNANGWGVAGGMITGPALRQIAFVIARHLSANQDLLTRYVVPLDVTNHLGDLIESNRLLPDSCETVAPKSGRWPSEWDAAALVSTPVPCFESTSPQQAQTPAADTTNITAVAQDASGAVWASGSRSGQLYRWSDGGWRDVPSPMPAPATSPQQSEYLRANGMIPLPLGLWPGPNGGVVVDWLDRTTQKSELFWQRGDQAKLLAVAPPVREGAYLDIETIAPAASGLVVLTRDQRSWRDGVPVYGQAPGVFRLDDSGQLNRIYTFALDHYRPYKSPDIPSFLPLSTIHDAQGKLWIWCGWSRSRDPRDAALEGLLVTDGKTAEYHRQIPGLPDAHLVSVDIWDGGHFAAATFGGGLYTIDTATFEVNPVSEPQPGAFRFVKKVFRAGDDRYVLTFEPNVNGGMSNDTPGAVWLLRDGQWQQISQDLPDASGVGLATAGGLWLSTSDFRGLWFVPAQGSARRVTAQQNLPLSDVQQLFQLPDGDILATEAGYLIDTRSAEFNPEAVLKPTVTSAGFDVIYPRTVLRPDRQRNLWGILQLGVLSEWNGSQWIPHPFPSLIVPSRIVGLDIDSHGRVWLFPNCRLGPMGIFDPAENRWATYQDYRAALAESVEPVRFLHAEEDRLRPIYGPNSQMVFVGMCWAANYFDGSSWHMWNRQELPGALDIERPPFFDASGHLAFDPNPRIVRSDNQLHRPGGNAPATWEWTPDLLWHIVPYQPGEVVPMPNPFAASPPPPAGCTTMSPSSLVQDSTGRAWWVADDALYTGTTGQCRPVLPGSAAHPFVDGRELVQALLDARGNVFLETRTPFSYVILPQSVYADPTQANATEK